MRAMARAAGSRADVEATLDRRAALDGADYVVTSFQVGGYRPATVVDFEVPKRYGLRQTIADTLGVGGIMRGLRTIPVLLDVCRDMEELCPDALLLQLRQPDGDAVLGGRRGPASIRTVGPVPLRPAHRRRAGRRPRARARRARLPRRRASTTSRSSCASSATARTSTRRCARSPRRPPTACATRCCATSGYFVTESSEHFAEYVPWFIKDGREPDLIERFNIPLDEYPRRCERADRRVGGAARAAPRAAARRSQTAPSVEYGADIIRACETGEPFAFNGNVPNALGRRAADRQPARPTAASRCRASPPRAGSSRSASARCPRQLAALMQTNVNVQGLTVEAALTGDREAVHHAAMLDPHTGGRALAGRDRRARRRR